MPSAFSKKLSQQETQERRTKQRHLIQVTEKKNYDTNTQEVSNANLMFSSVHVQKKNEF